MCKPGTPQTDEEIIREIIIRKHKNKYTAEFTNDPEYIDEHGFWVHCNDIHNSEADALREVIDQLEGRRSDH